MKIAITITDITGDGGTERTSILLANTFHEQGHDVTIISLFKKNTSECFHIDTGVKIMYVSQKPYSLEASKLERIKSIISTRNTLQDILKKESYDEIISQAFLPTFILYTIGNAKSITACEHFKYELYGKIGILIRNHVYKHCRRVITLTEKDSGKFKNAGIQNTVIPNMVTFPIGANVGQDNKKIVAAGRLSEQKGFDMLIRAMVPVIEKYPDWSLDIYGRGECGNDLMKLATELNVSNHIHFKGFCSNLADVFQNSTFFVLSSRFEGFPMILLEAVSQNLPCISFDCPEGPSVILRNDGGELVQPEDERGLSSAIMKFIESKDLRMKCAKQALKNIEDYSPHTIYRKWISTFHHE